MPSITFGRWNPTEVMERRLDGDWPNPTPFAFNLVMPTSVSPGGGGASATIGTNGTVTFTSVTSLYVNGVFTADYDNYMMLIRMSGTAGNDALGVRMSNGGVATSDTTYTYQYYSSLGTTVTGGRFGTQSAGRIGNTDNTLRSGDVVYIYGPYLAQPTVVRNTSVYGFGNAGIVDFAWTHGTSTSYDGLWLQATSASLTGSLSVYGLAN